MKNRRREFGPRSVCHRLVYGEFAHLPETLKRRLLRLIARISESSFRRGFQQGCLAGDPNRSFGRKAAGERLAIPPEKLRFERSLDSAPFPDSGQRCTALQRLDMEHGLELMEVFGMRCTSEDWL